MTDRRIYPENPTFECIAARRRREILRTLGGSGPALTEGQLAASLSSPGRRTPSPGRAEVARRRATLTQVHLPKLEGAGLITWERDEGRVETATHPAYDDPRFERLVETRIEGLDDVLSALSHEYRRIALTVLEDGEPQLSRTELAREIRRRVPGAASPDVPGVETISASLHHAHLPKLDNLGFVEYHPDTGRTAYEGGPVLEYVFAIIYEGDESTVEKLDGFLDGLTDTYRRASRETSTRLGWPHFWRVPHNG